MFYWNAQRYGENKTFSFFFFPRLEFWIQPLFSSIDHDPSNNLAWSLIQDGFYLRNYSTLTSELAAAANCTGLKETPFQFHFV